MEGAAVLERDFDVAPYFSRMMVRAVPDAVLPLIAHQGETSQPAS